MLIAPYVSLLSQEEELSETKIRIGLLEKKVEAAELEVCGHVTLLLCNWLLFLCN